MTESTIENNKEISLLRRNLRLMKRIVLGKKMPPLFLRVLCWLFLVWSLAMTVGFLFIGVGDMIGDSFNTIKDAKVNTPPKYFYTYALLHFAALIGVVLMWRKKVMGLYVFSIVTLLMPFWYFIITGVFEFNIYVFLFSVISIGLFAINWNIFTVNARKKEQKQENTEASTEFLPEQNSG